MVAVVAPSIWYPSGYPGPSYDLNTIVCWATDWENVAQVIVTFALSELTVVRFNKVDFEAVAAAYGAVADDSMRAEAQWVVGGSTYNLEKVSSWTPDADDPDLVRIRFSGSDEIVLVAETLAFETAYQLYQDAVVPS